MGFLPSALTSLPNIARDLVAATIGTGAALAWAGICVALSPKRRRSEKSMSLTRKVLHITSGPLFYATLPLYSSAATARLFAAAVPGVFAVRLYLASKPESTDGIGEAVARVPGNVSEAAGGPMSYALAVSAVCALAWTAPAGVVAMAVLAFGDGFAEAGAVWPVRRWPLPKSWPVKSVGGSAAFVVAGTVGAVAMNNLFGLYGLSPVVPVGRVAAVAIACAGVELLPFEDNYSVPAMALMLGSLLFRAGGSD